MSLKLYFLRHGQTPYSRDNLYCGSTNPDLTEEGHMMAKAIAKGYQSIPWIAVYASPMKRTQQTVKPLCDEIGIEPQIREGLRELDYGAWEGETFEAVKEKYHDDYVRWLTEPAWNPPTRGETAVQVAARASQVIAEIQQSHPSGDILIVAHKATIRIALCSLLGIDLGRYRDRIAAPVASLSVIKFDEHGPLLERLGDRAHLDDHLQNLPGT